MNQIIDRYIKFWSNLWQKNKFAYLILVGVVWLVFWFFPFPGATEIAFDSFFQGLPLTTVILIAVFSAIAIVYAKNKFKARKKPPTEATSVSPEESP